MVKKIRAASALVLVLLLVYSGAAAQEISPPAGSNVSGQEFVPGELLVRFRPWVAAEHADQLLVERGLSRLRRIAALSVDVLSLPPGLSVERAVDIFNRLPEVEFAEPNYILRILQISDPGLNNQWAPQQIDAPDAWSITEGDPSVVIAIVDTGVDYRHTELAPNMWLNDDPPNGIDDDANGKIDDLHGWDFVNNDGDPLDDHFHGSHVAGIAAAAPNDNAAGLVGICPRCRIMAVKVLAANGSGTLDGVANGITYAADNGAKVVSMSLGGAAGSATLESAVNYAWNRGLALVAGAGNDGGGNPFYPAAYANVMAIASTGDQDYRSCFSNYANYMSVAAPGEFIYSTTLVDANGQDTYGTFSGTSMATPHAAGLAGLLFSQDLTRTNAQVRSLMESTAEDLGPSGRDAFFGFGRINAYRAVTGNSTPTTPPVGLFSDDLTATGYAHARKLARDASGTLHLAWHGRDGGQYRVLYATSSDGGANWSSPQVVFQSSAETFHPALAVDGSHVYLVFPSKDGSANYRIFFARRPLSGGGSWTLPVAVMGGAYHAVRPDLYLDPTNGRLHLAASSLDNAPYVYYTSSSDGGASWSVVRQVSAGQPTRYAAVHADGPNVYIAARTLEFYFLFIPRYRVVTVRSLDDGNTWNSLTEQAVHDGLFGGEYGVSLAGAGDRLYLGYEHAGAVYFRRSEGGVGWSAAENLGAGAWPSLTQGGDGQAWLMWESSGSLLLRHYTGSAWDPAETVLSATGVNKASYPNLKLGTSGGRVEWTATHCSGAPYRLMHDSRALGANNPPAADNQSVTASEDTSVAITLTGSDPDGDSLTFGVVTGPAHGSLSGTPPNLTYTPNANFNGADSFTFVANDGTDNSAPATVSISVNPVNDPPVADSQSVMTPEDTPVAITLTGSDPDGDTLTFSLVTGPVNGSLTGTAPNLTYTPNANFNGTDSFTFKANDGAVDSVPATVLISVTPVNDPPVADSQSVTTAEDTSVAIALTGSDPDGDALTFSVVTGPANGSLSGTPPNLTYMPNPNYNGSDSFTFVANDGTVDGASATVSISVTPVNDPPAASFTYSCTGLTCNFDASASSDLDGAIVSYTWDFGDGGSGAVAIVTHTFGGGGTYTVMLTVTDDGGLSDTEAQTVSVSAPVTTVLYFSLGSDGTVGGLSVANEDIVAFDGTNFSLYFDGSAFGLAGFTIDAFAILDSNTILMSFTNPGAVPGIPGTTDDSDIVKFTSGTFSLYFDGSDVGLTQSGEDVDAIEQLTLPDGRPLLLVSTTNSFNVPGVSGQDEDIIAFTPSSLGPNTAGSWAMYFDGSDVGLADSSGEDVDGVAVAVDGNIYLSSVGNFSVNELSGADEDVYICLSPTTGPNTSCASFMLFFDGSAYGLGGNDLFAIELP